MLGNGVVQQRAFVGVLAAGLGWHLVNQRHTARAVDDALGGRAADDITVLHLVYSSKRLGRRAILLFARA